MQSGVLAAVVDLWGEGCGVAGRRVAQGYVGFWGAFCRVSYCMGAGFGVLRVPGSWVSVRAFRVSVAGFCHR